LQAKKFLARRQFPHFQTDLPTAGRSVALIAQQTFVPVRTCYPQVGYDGLAIVRVFAWLFLVETDYILPKPETECPIDQLFFGFRSSLAGKFWRSFGAGDLFAYSNNPL